MLYLKSNYLRPWYFLMPIAVAALLLGACSVQGNGSAPAAATSTPTPPATTQPGDDGASTPNQPTPTRPPVANSQPAREEGPATYTPDVTFTLRTEIAEGRLAFVGVGGAIDGLVNPALQVQTGEVVQINLINGDGAEHDISFPDFGATSERIFGQGASTSDVFRADRPGEFVYFCTVPGHRVAGMEGTITVGEGAPPVETAAPSVARSPADLPPPVGGRGPQVVKIELEALELEGP